MLPILEMGENLEALSRNVSIDILRINHVSITLHEIVHSFESGLAPERKGRKNHPGVFPGCRLQPTIRAFLTLRIGTPPSINHQILFTITTSISMTSFSRIVPPWIAFHVREPTGHKKGTPIILPEGTLRALAPQGLGPTIYSVSQTALTG